MSDELQDVPELPEEEIEEEVPEQEDDSEAPPETQPKPKASGPIKLGIDLDQTEEGRALKSVLMSQTAAVQRQLEAANARIAQLEAEVALTRQALQQAASPDQLPLIEQALQSEANARKVKQYEYQEWVRTWTANWEARAEQAGIDPKSEEFQQAIADTLANPQGGEGKLEVKIELARHGIGVKAKETPVRQPKQEHEEAMQRVQEDYALPPTGGHRVNKSAKLMEQYREELAATQGDIRRQFQVKMKYKKLGLDVY